MSGIRRTFLSGHRLGDRQRRLWSWCAWRIALLDGGAAASRLEARMRLGRALARRSGVPREVGRMGWRGGRVELGSDVAFESQEPAHARTPSPE